MQMHTLTEGWTTRWHYQPNCDQVMVEYVDTEGGSWKLLKDLECALQIKIENGEEAAVTQMIEDARLAMWLASGGSALGLL